MIGGRSRWEGLDRDTGMELKLRQNHSARFNARNRDGFEIAPLKGTIANRLDAGGNRDAGEAGEFLPTGHDLGGPMITLMI